ncbi:pentatricopeptide repeat-containing protein At2g13600-like [Amborella trichopoda]|uniref:pentatricopeptide repeat-containing protein At2g13600-like n=1 Tax=Amborella trichopoda TaxID=13333 RepID=UPI0009BCB160|nr:pentatricopeptide repeat-containing protein At2g13600-like [Amborella trichopoda]|eukprot:XP_011628778.2 pentatricopeptide repeat-containing protein At2g13600-like [Amborella trichopoda]
MYALSLYSHPFFLISTSFAYTTHSLSLISHLSLSSCEFLLRPELLRHGSHVFSHIQWPCTHFSLSLKSYNTTVSDTHHLFDKKTEPDQVLLSFFQNNSFGIKHTKYTLCTVLNSCSKLLNLPLGLQLHTQIVKLGHKENLFLSSALLDLYSKCGFMAMAESVFYTMKEHDEVSWTSIIAGCSQNGRGQEALELFIEMVKEDIKPNSFTFASVINACTGLSALDQGTQIHVHVIKIGIESNNFIAASLIDMYAKFGDMGRAKILFETSIQSDIVMYTSMITGYSQNLQCQEALKLFLDMQNEGMGCSKFTFASLLNSCGSLAAMEQGIQIHSLIIKNGFDSNVFVATSLNDMYAKCGCIDEARKAFDDSRERNSFLWSAMIMGYAQNGHGTEGLKLFEEMVGRGFKPDHVCFIGVLTACNHGGFLDKGEYYFNSMKDKYGLAPKLDHYACMVDLYGRTGHLKMANDLIDEMPLKPNSVMLSSLLGACKVHGDVELGKQVADKLFEMEPNSLAAHVTLVGIYAKAGLWEEVAKVRRLMRESGVRRRTGCSWIEVGKRMHAFVANDRAHPFSLEIYEVLDYLSLDMREAMHNVI